MKTGRHSVPLGFCLLLLFFSGDVRSSPLVNTENPTAFFTNVANWLLQSELQLSLNHIQIYPTNQYTPAVHRLLQLTANLYDAASDRSLGFQNPTPLPSPTFPAVFRPLFQSVNAGNRVYIVGFQEVTNLAVLSATMRDLTNPDERNNLTANDMIYGVPLVVGAAKGIPNFNEFAMQTRVYVTRFLEFRRPAGGDPNVTAVNETNQMYVVGISNIVGAEAWNSYTNPYPRNLQIIIAADLTAVLTNELGTILLTNVVLTGNVLNVTANDWPGWVNANQSSYSFVVPLTNNFLFLTNSTYVQNPIALVPFMHIFERSQPSFFPIPRWWLNLNIRLRYVLVDMEAQRVLDYVNLNRSEDTLDITGKLMEGADCSTIGPGTYENPGSHWCTNRLGLSNSSDAPTYGIMNQILVGLFGPTDFNRFTLDPAVEQNAHRAVDGFRFNLARLSPKYPEDQGVVFYKSNVFYAPLAPYSPIYIHTTWQANDPLVHYTMSDLLDLTSNPTNSVDFDSHFPPLDNLGFINRRYLPWGGNPGGGPFPPVGNYEPAAKDPLVKRSDDWSFPFNQSLSALGLGRAHRGTPWQTLYLKSAAIDSSKWQKWVGVTDPLEATLLQPTNDWHVASLLVSLFSDKDPRTLSSPNTLSSDGWKSLLNRLIAVTNVAPAQYHLVFVSSNSPQAATIATALTDARLSQPGQIFQDFGDILATSELSLASPWLNTNDPTINDEAYELLPAQILRRLRPDSTVSIRQAGGSLQIQFTGFDGYAYAVEASLNLADWTRIATNHPTNGAFVYLDTSQSHSPSRFYRSVLLP